jgi:outer membrane protein assembly factor BamD
VSILTSSTIRFRASAVLLTMLAVSACRNSPDRDGQSSPEIIYDRAHTALSNGDYNRAVSSYEALEARFPFSDAARQGRLDLMFAYYRSRQPEQAVDTADQFIRENPAHPRVDYAHYIKGLVYFEHIPGRIGRMFDTDLTKRPPTDALKSFAAFKTLVEQFPKSDYAHDARNRMIYLRNRLAGYEMAVARYYVRRGAYVGALARAKYTVETYDGSPSIREALELMTTCYRELNMPELAEQSARVYKENFPNAETIKEKKSWWKFWP